MGAEESMDTACSHLVTLCRGSELFSTALRSYEHAKANLGSWCSAHIWTFALHACREEALAVHNPQTARSLRILEHAEQVAHNLELAFPLPTWASVSEKLWQLVATLRSPANNMVQPALVLVSSVPSALVIAQFLEKVGRLGCRVGMDRARVTALTSGSEFAAKVDAFKEGKTDILVTSGITLDGPTMNHCAKVVQFDVAQLWDVADLAHYYMVIRCNHPLAGLLGRQFLKFMINTDVFVVNLRSTPGNLTSKSGNIYASKKYSEQEKTSFGMAYLTSGPVDALKSLISTNGQIPTVESWVNFANNYKATAINQQPSSFAASSPVVTTVQATIGYSFSNAQVLIDALSLGTPACERLEFIGDAALDLVAMLYWTDEYSTAPWNKVKQVASASVCNHFLGMVFIELGLHQWVKCSPEFRSNIAQVVASHNAMLATNPTWDFWMEIDYPKELADIMEAILGGVYIDSEFDVAAVASAFKKTLLPAIHKHLPINIVYCLNELERRCGHFQFTFKTVQCAQDGISTVECSATLGGTTLAKATHTKKALAKRVVCRRVLERLSSDPDSFTGLCKCFPPRGVGSE
jgi:dsRNA-specific ribonuclease